LGAALQTCANGVWGLFGQNEHLERYSDASDDARRLLAMTAEIEALRKRLGYVEPNALCARYLAHRGPWTPKDLGEPRLAKQFLTEIEAGLLE
jgi:hypothetical protein